MGFKIALPAMMLFIGLFAQNACAAKGLSGDKDPGYDLRLQRNGYELTEESLRKVFDNCDTNVITDCIGYIEQQQMVGLLPDVKAYFAKLDRKESSTKDCPMPEPESTRLRYVQCILALDKNMDQKTLDAYLVRIRRRLFDVKEGDAGYYGSPINAYNALLAAQKYQHVDIREDLEFLSMTDIMKLDNVPTERLFELYGNDLRDSDIDELLKPWKDNPERQEFILRRAKEHGLKLNTPTPKAP